MEEKSALELYQSMRDDFFKKISEEDPDFKRLYDNKESSSLAQDQLTFSFEGRGDAELQHRGGARGVFTRRDGRDS